MAEFTTKTEIKEEAQRQLLQAMQTAFYAIYDDTITGSEKDAIAEEASNQMKRVEKLFGYEPGSWARG